MNSTTSPPTELAAGAAMALLVNDDTLKMLAEEEIPNTDSEGFSESVRILKAEDRSTAAVPAAELETIASVADEFIRSYLVRKGFHKTLRVFEEEWLELLECGKLQNEDTADFADIYAQNEYLNGQVTFLREQMENQEKVTRKAVENFDRISLISDQYRIRDKQSTIELKQLRSQLKRVSEHYASFQPAMEQLKAKYDVLFREKSLTCLQLEKARLELRKLEASIPLENATSGNSLDLTVSDLPEERAVNHESAETTDGAAAASKTASGTVTTAATTLTSTLDDGQQSGGSFFRQALDELIPVNEAGSSLTESSYKTDSEPISFPSDSMRPLLELPPRSNNFVECTLDNTLDFVLQTSFSTHRSSVPKMCLSPDESILVTVGDDRLWHAWLLPQGSLVMTGQGHLQGVTAAEVHPSMHKLATVSADSTARIWDMDTEHGGSCSTILTGEPQDLTMQCFWDCSWNWSGQCLAAGGSSGLVHVWEAETSQVRYSIQAHASSVNALTFISKSDLLCTVSSDMMVSLWDVRASKKVMSFVRHRSPITAVATTAQGDLIASADAGGGIHIWDIATRSEVYAVSFAPTEVTSLTFDPSGEVLAAGLADGTVRILFTSDETAMAYSAHTAPCRSCHFGAASSKLYTSCSDGLVNVWQQIL